MHHHPIPGVDPDVRLQQAVLGLLLHDHCGLWSVDEVARAMAPDRVDDVLADLHAAGLVHRCGEFVFASRAAAAAELIAA